MSPLVSPHTTDSARQAEAILQAWQKGDQAQLESEMDAVSQLARSATDTNELERLEVLGCIANEIRKNPRPAGDPGMEVCRELLRHLASISLSQR
jgi:hypothetical protein